MGLALSLASLAAAASLALAAGVALAASQPAGEDGDIPMEDTQPQDVGVLVVRVQMAGRLGVAPAPGLPAPATRVFGLADGALVQVVDPAAPETVVAEQVADASGEVRFDLPPGRYLAIVPWADQAPGLPGATPVGAHLPDGSAVLAWSEAELPAGETVELVLSVIVALV
ncbi:MAG: hypothetical protein HY690_03050 [Chloroflexi bacterium]|nr:hypothetical protein [Chloroflexota bacterium]